MKYMKCIYFSDKLPFDFPLGGKEGLQKPAPLKKQELPKTLSLVGSINREILTKAITYKTNERSTAKQFLIDLSNYKCLDGSC